MTSVSSLPSSALNASKAALAAAIADNTDSNDDASKATDGASQPPNLTVDTKAQDESEDKEPGEIQEVNMETQAEEIRTVFNDPERFNVKVIIAPLSPDLLHAYSHLPASSLLTLDIMVRFSCNKGAKPSSDAKRGLPPDTVHTKHGCSRRLDGRHQTCHYL